MKKLGLALLATAALVTVTAASAAACHGTHHRAVGFRTTAFAKDVKGGAFERLRGTGSSFAAGSATASGSVVGRPLDDGTFSSSISTDWSKEFSGWNNSSCAPSTGTLSLTGTDSSNTLGTSVAGVTCTVGSNPRNIAAVFFGKSQVTSATGSLSSVRGYGRVLLVEKTDGTVKGFSFAGFKGWEGRRLAAYSREDAHHCAGRR